MNPVMAPPERVALNNAAWFRKVTSVAVEPSPAGPLMLKLPE